VEQVNEDPSSLLSEGKYDVSRALAGPVEERVALPLQLPAAA
jgi:hypothetical protein